MRSPQMQMTTRVPEPPPRAHVRRGYQRFHGLLVGMALIGCSDSMGLVCTNIGCESGLGVEFANPATAPFRVEATVSGASGAVYAYECQDVGRCGQGAFFGDFTPDWVIVTVSTEGRSQQYELRPQYSVIRPNGPRCGGCRKATVTVQLP